MNFHFRSWLFTGADDPNRITSAFKKGADFVVLDWEDAVTDGNKPIARENIRQFEQHYPKQPYGIRINAIHTPEGLEDICYIIKHQLKPVLVLLSKTNHEHEVALLDHLINSKGGDKIYIVPIIETSRGIQRIDNIATASPAISAMIYGAADLSADMNVPLEWERFEYIREKLVIAATSAGIQPVDTACFNIGSDKQLQAECGHAKYLGFTGKAAIHPNQVNTINQHISFSDDEVSEAKETIIFMQTQKQPITLINGDLVGPPMCKHANAIIKEAAARGQHGK